MMMIVMVMVMAMAISAHKVNAQNLYADINFAVFWRKLSLVYIVNLDKLDTDFVYTW